MNRRCGILSALLATALLLYAMPGLLSRHLGNIGRTDDRLKPAPSRTLVVWVTSWMEEDRKLISRLCTAFEKQQPGLRVYLRLADAQELAAPEAVLPDVVLHVTGDILSPQDGLLPIGVPEGIGEQLSFSGRSQGVQYALPLWYSPLVFSMPKAWMDQHTQQEQSQGITPGQPSLLGSTPPQTIQQEIAFSEVPWRRLLETGQVVVEHGIGLPMLQLQLPASLREEWRFLDPAIRKLQAGEAGVCSQKTHMEREEDAISLPFQPEAAQQVRYVSLCRHSEAGEAFVNYLLGEEAQAAALEAFLHPVYDDHGKPTIQNGQHTDDTDPYLPNAFLMDALAVDQYCIQDMRSGEDPVATLLKLR